MIFPKFENGQVIDEIREKYDPLAKNVRPHVTLVFPFDSDIEKEELKDHIESAISKCRPFELVLKGMTPNNAFGRHLFLNVQKGRKEIIEIHKRFYTGILEKYFPEWLKDTEFLPHMTIGNFDNDKEYEIAIRETKNIDDCFKTIVNEISVEIIDENEDSIIELNIPIK